MVCHFSNVCFLPIIGRELCIHSGASEEQEKARAQQRETNKDRANTQVPGKSTTTAETPKSGKSSDTRKTSSTQALWGKWVAVCLGRGRKEATQKRQEGKGEETLVLSACPPHRRSQRQQWSCVRAPLKTVMRCDAKCFQDKLGMQRAKNASRKWKGWIGKKPECGNHPRWWQKGKESLRGSDGEPGQGHDASYGKHNPIISRFTTVNSSEGVWSTATQRCYLWHGGHTESICPGTQGCLFFCWFKF